MLVLLGVSAALALPSMRSGLDGLRAAAAARHLAALIQSTRVRAVTQSVHVGLRFEHDGERYRYAMYADGDGDGLRARDIRSGVDARLTDFERVGDRFPGVDIGIAAAMPDIAGGALEAAVPAALERLVPIRAARLTAAPALPLAAREGPGDASLRFPMPVPSYADLALEVSISPGFVLDAWDRQALRQAARVVGLLIASRNQAAPPGQPPEPAAPLVGASAPMRRLREHIERVAATDFTILIEGECGSGKELVARQVHELSRRRGGPFVAVNCAALVETLLEAELFGIEDRVATGVRARRGKFELADQGTLFLDEVADLSPAAQAKLLRAIQELSVERVGGHGARPVDIRIVVATNQRLRRLADEGRFRTDLYYRLAGVELQVPPLRQRREDIVSLAEHFLARHDGLRRLTLSDSVADALRTHDWPGNVRELQRVVERALALATEDTIGLQDLPAELTRDYTELLQPSITRTESMRAWGSRYARLMLERCGRNKRRTCEVLGISYHTLQSYLRHPS